MALYDSLLDPSYLVLIVSTTSSSPVPTTTPLPPAPSFALTYHVEAEYSPELADTESEAYQNMSSQVVDAVGFFYNTHMSET